MIVMKFGGTSVSNAKNIKNVAKIVEYYLNKKPIVIVSAVAKITDLLVKLANESGNPKRNEILQNIKNVHQEILEKLNIDKKLLKNEFDELGDLSKNNKNIDSKILDNFQSFGERMSAKIIAEHLNKSGIKSKSFNSWDLGFLTNSQFGNAEPIEASYSNLRTNIKKLKVLPVVTGFIGKTQNGEITTLGRGGSDYTAAIIASAIDAEELQIWTDVDGIMSTDPKLVSDAKTIEKVSFAEASELAYFGAKVLHPKTILPAMRKNIPVKVLNSFNPKNSGTTILNKSNKAKNTVKAIAYKKNTTLINVTSTRMLGAYGFLARIFYIFDKYRKSVDVVSTSEVSVSVTVDNGHDMDSIMQELNEIADVEVLKNKSIICVVGEGMKDTLGIISETFSTLEKNKINVEMISHGASKINITFIVDGKDTEKTVKLLHKEYFG